MLDDSKHLIVLLSPQATSSKWVNAEIEYWIANKDPSEITIVVSRNPRSGGSRPLSTFAWSGEDVPPAMREVSVEPNAVDMRWAFLQPDGQLDRERWRGNVAEIAAAIRGQNKDELIGEVVAMRLRARIFATTLLLAGLILAVSAVASFVGWRAASNAAQQAEERRDAAEAATLTAESLRQAAQLSRDEANAAAAAAEMLRQTADESAEAALNQAEQAQEAAVLAAEAEAQALRASAAADAERAAADLAAAQAEEAKAIAEAARDLAQAERLDAERAAREAVSRREVAERELEAALLAVRSIELSSTEPAVAAVVAAESISLILNLTEESGTQLETTHDDNFLEAPVGVDAILRATDGYPRLVRVLPLARSDGSSPHVRFEDVDPSVKGDELITVSDDVTKKVWSVPDGDLLLSTNTNEDHGQGPVCPYVPDLRLDSARTLRIGEAGQAGVLQWLYDDGDVVRFGPQFQLDTSCVDTVAVDSSGRFLAVSTMFPRDRRPMVGIWEISASTSSRAEVTQIPSQRKSTRMMSSDGNVLAIQTQPARVILLDLQDGTRSQLDTPGEMVAMSYDGSALVIRSSSDLVTAIDWRSDRVLLEVATPSFASAAIAKDGAGAWLTAIGDTSGDITIWRSEQGTPGQRWISLGSVSDFGYALEMNISHSGQLLTAIVGPTLIGFGVIALVELQGPDESRVVEVEGHGPGWVNVWLEAEPEGGRVVTGSWDRTRSFIEVIDVTTNDAGLLEARLVNSFTLPTQDGALSRNGRFLAAISEYRTAQDDPVCSDGVQSGTPCVALALIDLDTGTRLGSSSGFGPIAADRVAIRQTREGSVLVAAGQELFEWSLNMQDWISDACSNASEIVLDRAEEVLGRPPSVC